MYPYAPPTVCDSDYSDYRPLGDVTHCTYVQVRVPCLVRSVRCVWLLIRKYVTIETTFNTI
jgi:hypothetical protein